MNNAGCFKRILITLKGTCYQFHLSHPHYFDIHMRVDEQIYFFSIILGLKHVSTIFYHIAQFSLNYTSRW